MSQVTVSGLTVTVSDEEGRRMAEQDTERLRKQKKLSLVLDLITPWCATNDVRARHYLNRLDVRTLVLPMLEEPSPQQQTCSCNILSSSDRTSKNFGIRFA
jgi:hypothetical protein